MRLNQFPLHKEEKTVTTSNEEHPHPERVTGALAVGQMSQWLTRSRSSLPSFLSVRTQDIPLRRTKVPRYPLLFLSASYLELGLWQKMWIRSHDYYRRKWLVCKNKSFCQCVTEKSQFTILLGSQNRPSPIPSHPATICQRRGERRADALTAPPRGRVEFLARPLLCLWNHQKIL